MVLLALHLELLTSTIRKVKWAGLLLDLPSIKGIIMLYFKRKDGSVFGKLDSISKKQIDSYIKDGCEPCNENGEEKKPKKKSILKKKKK